MTDAFSNRPTSLADYLAILRRRAWIIVIPLVLAPILTLLVSSEQQPLYRSSASVYINRTPATSTATGIFDQSAAQDPVRFFQTQADLARDPILLAAAAKAAHVGAGPFTDSSSVSPSVDADLLIFSVDNRHSTVAARLANAYAKAFTTYQPAQDRKTLTLALQTVTKKMATLRSQGVSASTPVYENLLNRESQLETALALQAGSAPTVVQPAHGAVKIRPRTKRDVLLGVALGAILGIGLAFLGEALDKRVRSEREIEEILGLPLLARLPRPRRSQRKADELAMLAAPRSVPAEAVRKLRTNLEFVNLDTKARTIMVTSAVEQEGKSTTIAGLAVALVRAGRRVALVDLDLRKPYLHRFFRIPSVPGITDVIDGRASLADAMKPIIVIPGSDQTTTRVAPYLSGARDAPSLLSLLPAGTMRPDPGEFIGSEGLLALIEKLSDDWDFVLIDAPPLPAVADALTLSASVDAIVVITRFGAVHHRMLHELARLLDASPAVKLGYVLTGSERGDVYDYGYGHSQATDAAAEAPTRLGAHRSEERDRRKRPHREAGRK